MKFPRKPSLPSISREDLLNPDLDIFWEDGAQATWAQRQVAHYEYFRDIDEWEHKMAQFFATSKLIKRMSAFLNTNVEYSCGRGSDLEIRLSSYDISIDDKQESLIIYTDIQDENGVNTGLTLGYYSVLTDLNTGYSVIDKSFEFQGEIDLVFTNQTNDLDVFWQPFLDAITPEECQELLAIAQHWREGNY